MQKYIFTSLTLGIILLSLAACSSKQNKKEVYAQNTVVYDESLPPNEAMAKYLADCQKQYFENPHNRFACNVTADNLAQQPAPKDKNKFINWKKDIGYWYLSGGQTEKGIPFLEEALKAATDAKADKDVMYSLQALQAIAYLRLGEQKNCIANHVAESCILPIAQVAMYQVQEPTRKAIELYKEILAKNPADLNAMFLLNVAYMNVGEYPQAVPQQYLINPQIFSTQPDVGKFKNIAINTSLATVSSSGGAIIEDFNNDGLLDIFNTGWLLTENVKLMINKGDGTFSDKTDSAGLKGITGGLHCVQTDYNNDGFMDIFIPRGAWWNDFGKLPNSLLKNNGDGTFTEVTKSSGLWSLYPTQSAAWADFNNDGWLDVFIGNESRRDAKETYPCELFLNKGDGTFQNVAKELGLALEILCKGVSAGDYDNDGDEDLVISFQGYKNILLRNDLKNGELKFTDVSKEAGIENPSKTFPSAFFDYNNDGWQDLVICTYDAGNCEYDNAAEFFGKERKGEISAIFKNNGNGTFTNANSELQFNASMTCMGLNYGDVNNDGWLDIYFGTGTPEYTALVPNRMFLNEGGKHMQDITYSAGLGHLQKGHGIAFGDVDNDGDQDIFSDFGGGFEGDAFQSAFFENPGNDNNWVTLKLIGTKSNKAAIGTKVTITAANADGSEQKYYHIVSSGASFGANSMQLECGLGTATAIKKIEITWAGSGTKQVLENLPLKQRITITEGNSAFEVSPLVPFRFTGNLQTDSTHHHMHM